MQVGVYAAPFPEYEWYRPLQTQPNTVSLQPDAARVRILEELLAEVRRHRNSLRAAIEKHCDTTLANGYAPTPADDALWDHVKEVKP